MTTQDRITQLETAIRKHRDQRGDDRCWVDDMELYEVLAESEQPVLKLPPRSVFLRNCARYWECRQKSSDKDAALKMYQEKL